MSFAPTIKPSASIHFQSQQDCCHAHLPEYWNEEHAITNFNESDYPPNGGHL